MSLTVLTDFYSSLPIRKNEVLRYAGCKDADTQILKLIDECLGEVKNAISFRVCSCEFSVEVQGKICDFKTFRISSEKLAKNLSGCNKAVVFAATVGVGIDRLISKYSYISPSKALIFQAIGAERIETLCDAFCSDIEKKYGVKTKPRFSPGYGDLPIETQKDIFSMLDCERKIGLTLNDTLLMSPTKSVTAIVGIEENTNIGMEI